MQVHERYLGRTLRCTSCRTEFLADPPIGNDDQSFETAEEEGEPKPSRRWILAVIVLLIPVVAVLWWLGQDQSGGFARSLFHVERSVGELGSLDAGAEGPVPVAFDRESVIVLLAAVDAGNPQGLQELRAAGRCLDVPSGTRVRVLEHGRKDPEARVRIVDGPWASRIVWVPARWIQ